MVSFPRHGCPRLKPNGSPSRQVGGRRECRVKAPPMARLRKKSTGGRHHRQSRSTGIPCATVLTLIRSLPGAPACWPPWRQCAFAHCAGHQHRGVGTLRLHVRSLAVRPRIPRTRCGKTTAIAPRPACRDDRAQRPFRMRRDARSRALFLEIVKTNLAAIPTAVQIRAVRGQSPPTAFPASALSAPRAAC